MSPQRSQTPGVLAYAISFAAGGGGAVIFWLLRTPTPVPPLIGLIGLLGIAFGETAISWILRAAARRRART